MERGAASGVIRPRKAAARFQRIHHSDLTELTYEAIRKRILRRELMTGEQIPVDRVASQLGVSRTPVLDAIKRLSAEGLVGIRARRGCFVRGLNATDIHDIFGLREALEVYGASRAIAESRHRQLAADLQRIVQKMEPCTNGDSYTDYDSFIEWDRAFHVAIVESSGNKRIEETYTGLNVHLHIMRAHYFREIQKASEVHADHAAILKAIRRGDISGTRSAISDHLSAVRDRMMADVERNGGSI